jgi:AcrR family transcriptional regulator
MAEPATIPDRRQRRRQESIEEIIDVALDVMAEQGVAGLSLGEVARRLGMRPPSLYVYFASKNALYDAAFARGAREVLALIDDATPRVLDAARDLETALLEIGTTFIRWAVEHPVYSQLLFWRPVPGFTPSPEAYEPAVGLMELSRATFEELQERGWVRRDLSAAEILRDWTVVTAGITSQQLSNAPDAGFERGQFTAALPNVVAMFVNQYSTSESTARTTTKKETGNRNADKR